MLRDDKVLARETSRRPGRPAGQARVRRLEAVGTAVCVQGVRISRDEVERARLCVHPALQPKLSALPWRRCSPASSPAPWRPAAPAPARCRNPGIRTGRELPGGRTDPAVALPAAQSLGTPPAPRPARTGY